MVKNIVQQALEKYQAKRGQALKVQAFLFDMDGILYNSMPAHERSWLETAKQYQLPMTQNDVYMFEGQTGGQSIEILIQRKYQRSATPEEIKQIYACKTRLFNQYNTGELIPQVEQVLERVRSFRPIVVTGSSQASLLDKLNDNFPEVFELSRIVTGRDVVQGKPHPEPYLRGMALANTDPWQTIVVENAPAGVTAAVAAGCFTIAVNTGPLPDEVLRACGADIVVADMQGLLECLDYIL